MKTTTELLLDTHFLRVKFDDAEPLNVEVKEIYCVPNDGDEHTGQVWILPDFEKMGRKPFLDINGAWKRFLEANGEDQVLVNVGSRETDVSGSAYWADGILGRAPTLPPVRREMVGNDEEWWIIEGEMYPGPFVDEGGEPIGD